MPVLQNEEKIERFYLPSTKDLPEAEQAFVDMDTGELKTGDMIGVDPSAGEVEIGIRMLTARIKGWNFTDANGTDLEVNFDNVQKLSMDDFTFLADKIPQGSASPLTTAQKKI